MNYLIVVEGASTETKIYPYWIKLLNPELSEVAYITEITENNFYIVSGHGYPQYLGIIDHAIEDMHSMSHIDKLVIAVDSETLSYQEKFDEIERYINGRVAPGHYAIIIQHCCIESWTLGNRLIIKRNPQDRELREFIRFYDVTVNDPEEMESINEDLYNKAQFAYAYFKKSCNDRWKNLTYTKRNPHVVLNEKFFKQMCKRLEETGHIQSFKTFLDTFSVA